MSSDSHDFVQSFFKQLHDIYSDTPASQIKILLDDGVARFWPFTYSDSSKKESGNFEIIIVPGGEIHKNLEGLASLWSLFRSHHLDRSSLVIVVGGGALLDRAGLAAATYMRGMPFVFVPTTLLSMVDVGIGGKMGINFEGIKNLVGTFYNPEATLINPMFLKTLPQRELVAGYAELIKHALLDKNSTLLTELENRKIGKNSKVNEPPMEWLEHSIYFKQQLVDADPYELEGIRKQLNLGHTLGHALESLSAQTEHPLLHGEAVAIGLVLESRLSFFLGGLEEDEFFRIERIISNFGLPTCYPALKSFAIREQIYLLLKHDKKNSFKNDNKIEKWSFTLLNGLGKAEVDVLLDKEILELFFESFEAAL